MGSFLGFVAFFFIFIHLMCAIGVFLALSERVGFILAILMTFCTGGIVTYFWGWLFWKSESKLMVMSIWTGAIILANVFSYLSQDSLTL